MSQMLIWLPDNNNTHHTQKTKVARDQKTKSCEQCVEAIHATSGRDSGCDQPHCNMCNENIGFISVTTASTSRVGLRNQHRRIEGSIKKQSLSLGGRDMK